MNGVQSNQVMYGGPLAVTMHVSESLRAQPSSTSWLVSQLSGAQLRRAMSSSDVLGGTAMRAGRGANDVAAPWTITVLNPDYQGLDDSYNIAVDIAMPNVIQGSVPNTTVPANGTLSVPVTLVVRAKAGSSSPPPFPPPPPTHPYLRAQSPCSSADAPRHRSRL